MGHPDLPRWRRPQHRGLPGPARCARAALVSAVGEDAFGDVALRGDRRVRCVDVSAVRRVPGARRPAPTPRSSTTPACFVVGEPSDMAVKGSRTPWSMGIPSTSPTAPALWAALDGNPQTPPAGGARRRSRPRPPVSRWPSSRCLCRLRPLARLTSRARKTCLPRHAEHRRAQPHRPTDGRVAGVRGRPPRPRRRARLGPPRRRRDRGCAAWAPSPPTCPPSTRPSSGRHRCGRRDARRLGPPRSVGGTAPTPVEAAAQRPPRRRPLTIESPHTVRPDLADEIPGRKKKRRS